MVQAEPDDGLHMLQGDGVLALVGSQGAGGLICGDVATYAVHIQQAADLANLHLQLAVHLHMRAGHRGSARINVATRQCSHVR